MNPQTSKNLGGVGALLLFIGSPLSYTFFFAGPIPLIGLMLVLIALKGFADHYKDAGIFNNALYGFITAIVGVVAGLGALIVTALGILVKEAITDWIKLAKWTAALTVRGALIYYYGRVILAFIVIFIFAMLTARFYRKSLSLLASKSRVDLFSTAGLLLLIGAVLTIIVLGLLLIWISFLIIAIAFFSIKTTVAEPTPPSPPS